MSVMEPGNDADSDAHFHPPFHEPRFPVRSHLTDSYYYTLFITGKKKKEKKGCSLILGLYKGNRNSIEL